MDRSGVAMIQNAVAREVPLLIIDEDGSAANLLTWSCLRGDDETPLAEILSGAREKMGKTALVVAACAADTLIAHATGS
jgi:predicted ABC-class ATPase